MQRESKVDEQVSQTKSHPNALSQLNKAQTTCCNANPKVRISFSHIYAAKHICQIHCAPSQALLCEKFSIRFARLRYLGKQS
jgi:hypothetical protein